ncbi:MAG: hypothetical protein IJO76_03215, partial [Clostridia bacterium]|nr:hypothetical protein [Clostridia bacterium]
GYTYYTVIDGVVTEKTVDDHMNFWTTQNTAGWIILPLPQADKTWTDNGSNWDETTNGIVGVDLTYVYYAGAAITLDQFGFTKDVDLFKEKAAAGLENLNGYDNNAEALIGYLGTSINEAQNALRFGFTLTGNGIVKPEDGFMRDISNATITIGDNEYKLVDFGAIISNVAGADMTIAGAAADGKRTKNIVGERVFDVTADGTAFFACGIKNIPADYTNALIYARPYFIYNNGVEDVVVYGDVREQSINGYLALLG